MSVQISMLSGPSRGHHRRFEASTIAIGAAGSGRLEFATDGCAGLQRPLAELRYEWDGWRIRQCGPARVVVNQTTLRRSTALKSGDLVRLAGSATTLRFEIVDRQATTSATPPATPLTTTPVLSGRAPRSAAAVSRDVPVPGRRFDGLAARIPAAWCPDLGVIAAAVACGLLLAVVAKVGSDAWSASSQTVSQVNPAARMEPRSPSVPSVQPAPAAPAPTLPAASSETSPVVSATTRERTVEPTPPEKPAGPAIVDASAPDAVVKVAPSPAEPRLEESHARTEPRVVAAEPADREVESLDFVRESEPAGASHAVPRVAPPAEAATLLLAVEEQDRLVPFATAAIIEWEGQRMLLTTGLIAFRLAMTPRTVYVIRAAEPGGQAIVGRIRRDAISVPESFATAIARRGEAAAWQGDVADHNLGILFCDRPLPPGRALVSKAEMECYRRTGQAICEGVFRPFSPDARGASSAEPIRVERHVTEATWHPAPGAATGAWDIEVTSLDNLMGSVLLHENGKVMAVCSGMSVRPSSAARSASVIHRATPVFTEMTALAWRSLALEAASADLPMNVE